MEIWKNIPSYDGVYQVSNLGRIKNLKSGMILKPQERRHGYLSVWLYGNGKRKQLSIHRIVAEAFCNHPVGKDEVNHINEDKQDNRAENLEWVSHKENSVHGTRQKRIGEGQRKRTDHVKPIEQLDMDGNVIARYPSMKAMEDATGFNKSNVCNFIRGKNNNTHQYGYKWRYATKL